MFIPIIYHRKSKRNTKEQETKRLTALSKFNKKEPSWKYVHHWGTNMKKRFRKCPYNYDCENCTEIWETETYSICPYLII